MRSTPGSQFPALCFLLSAMPAIADRQPNRSRTADWTCAARSPPEARAGCLPWRPGEPRAGESWIACANSIFAQAMLCRRVADSGCSLGSILLRAGRSFGGPPALYPASGGAADDGIDFTADQKCQPRQVEPQHQGHDRAHAPISRRIVMKILEVFP